MTVPVIIALGYALGYLGGGLLFTGPTGTNVMDLVLVHVA